MSKKKHTLKMTLANRPKAIAYIDRAIELGRGVSKRPWVMEVREQTRSAEQNDRLHAMLTDVSQQVEWNGSKRDVEAWKDIFTAALRSANHNLDVVPGLYGGFVLLGMHTSSMTVAELGDLMTLIEAWGAENGVVFRDQEERRAAA